MFSDKEEHFITNKPYQKNFQRILFQEEGKSEMQAEKISREIGVNSTDLNNECKNSKMTRLKIRDTNYFTVSF